MYPKDCYKDFEKATDSWGFDYTRNGNGYEDYATGSAFGSFALGWMARDSRAN